jgi:hypothetical protein
VSTGVQLTFAWSVCRVQLSVTPRSDPRETPRACHRDGALPCKQSVEGSTPFGSTSCPQSDRGSARVLGKHDGSVQLRVRARSIRCRLMAGRWLLVPAMKVRLLPPELRLDRQVARHWSAKPAHGGFDSPSNLDCSRSRVGSGVGLLSRRLQVRALSRARRLRSQIGIGAEFLIRRLRVQVSPKTPPHRHQLSRLRTWT